MWSISVSQPHLHEQAILRSFEKRKHVLCEKPLALSVDSARRIRSALSRSGSKLMITQVIRFWPQYREIRKIVESGAVGSIEEVHAYRVSEKPGWAQWLTHSEQGGGALFDLHIHDVDFVYALCGRPESVIASGSRGDLGAWDAVSALWTWKNKYAVVQADWCNPPGFPFQFGIRVRGSRGTLEYRFGLRGNIDRKEAAEEQLLAVFDGSVRNIDCSGYRDGYEEEIRCFLHCIEGDRSIEDGSVDQAIEVLGLIEEEKRSLESGKKRRISARRQGVCR